MSSSIDLCQVPAAPSPNKHSDFDSATSLAPALMGVMGVMIAWGILFTAARFYLNIRQLGWSDYLSLISLLMSISILGIESSQLTQARHLWDIPACFFDASYARLFYFTAILMQCGLFLAKASIFLLFRRLFMIKSSMRIAIWIGLIFDFLLYAIGIAVATYYETPRTGEPWTAILDGRTLIPIKWWQLQSGLSILLDLYILILPLPVVAKLKMPVRQRILVIAVFSLAIMGIGASIASLIVRIQITHTIDQSWISTVLSICSSVELNVAIIVSSAPDFASFTRLHLLNLSVVKLLRSSFSSTSKNKLYNSDLARGNAIPLDHRYHGLKDKWAHTSEATAYSDRTQGIESVGLPIDGIVQTLDVEQHSTH